MIPSFLAIVFLLALGEDVGTSPVASDSKCPRKGTESDDEQWRFFNDSCYLLASLPSFWKQNWDWASEVCKFRDGHLAVIRTAEENDFIVKNVLPEPSGDKDDNKYGAWIGLHLKWATCDGCNYVESANWIDNTPMEASALLPKPITQLTDKYGKYPWLGGTSAQPDRFGKDDGCAHYFNIKGFSVGDWGLAACDYTLMFTICQKKALQ